MKKGILIALLFFTQQLIAQYEVNWMKAPFNPVPIKYTKQHFNLNGSVKKFVGKLITVSFNETGKVKSKSTLAGGENITYKNGKIDQIKDASLFYGSINTVTLNSNNTIATIKTGSTGNKYTYKYNTKGLFSQTLKNNIIIESYSYDSKGRIVKKEEFKNGSSVGTEKYSYKLNQDKSQIVTITISDGNSTLTEKHYVDIYGNVTEQLFGKPAKKPLYDKLLNFIGTNSRKPENKITYYEIFTKGKCISGDCFNKYSTYKYSNNNQFTGNFVGGKIDGRIYYTNPNGNFGTYVYKNFVPDGKSITYNKDLQMVQIETFKQGKALSQSYYSLKYNKTTDYKTINGASVELSRVTQTLPTFFFDENQGCLAGNCKDVKSIYKFKSNEIYIGEFKNSLKHGNGTFFWLDGNSLTIKYVNDLPHGIGIYYNYKTKKTSTVTYNNGKPEPNKNTKVGCDTSVSFDNCQNGKGKYYYSNGDYFSGFFRNGKKHGKGYYYWSDGSQLSINYVDDKEHGEGVFYDGIKKRERKCLYQYGKFIKFLN